MGDPFEEFVRKRKFELAAEKKKEEEQKAALAEQKKQVTGFVTQFMRAQYKDKDVETASHSIIEVCGVCKKVLVIQTPLGTRAARAEVKTGDTVAVRTCKNCAAKRT